MKKILHIQKVTGIAGSERHLLTLLPYLVQRGWDVTFLILTEPDKPLEEYATLLREKGVQTYRLLLRNNVDPFCLLAMYRFLKRECFDLVHTHLIHADLYGTLAAKLAGVPHVISTKHNDDTFRTSLFIKMVTRMANRQCARVITISHHMADFAHRVEGIPVANIMPIHYGLLSCEKRLDNICKIREEFAVPYNAALVLSIGRLTEQKGHRYLLEAWRTVARADLTARLFLIGDGPLRRRLTIYVRELGLDGRVVFTGWRNDVPALLDAADVYAHPSLWEGFGLVLLEAMAAGKPVIASRVSAIPEIVVDNETGWLVPSRNSEALADALLRLLKNPTMRLAMGEAGRKRVRQDFGVERMVNATERTYKEVLTVGTTG